MSAPDTGDDIVSAVVAYLGAQLDVLAVLGTDTDETPWLYQYRLWAPVEGTGSTAAVLSCDGGWTGPNLHNTMRFPRLLLSVWADPMRDASGNVTDYGEVNRRVSHAYEAIDKHLHRAGGEAQMWASVRTVSCSRLTEPFVYAVPDGDGLLRLQTYYAVCQG